VAGIDYSALASRAFDEVLSAEDQAALRVWADLLEENGDPRGPLITIEHAFTAARERRSAVNAHLLDHGQALIGELREVLAFPRALTLDWRAGRLYGATLDARYAPAQLGIPAVELVDRLIAAPAMLTARKLHVRVRTAGDVANVVVALVKLGPALPLEQIAVLTGVRALRFQVATSTTGALTTRYPSLWLIAVGAMLHAMPAKQPRDRDVPQELAGRIAIGRALIQPDAALRGAAVARIAELRERGLPFVDALMMLLQPGVIPEQEPIAACLGCLRAPAALPLLATITGRVALYDLPTRRAAGVAIARIRGVDSPRDQRGS
jgi:hypothetical protein